MNYFVVPPYYEGTSFEQIYLSIKDTIKKCNLDVQIIGCTKALTNTLFSNLLDDERYTDLQCRLINDITHLNNPTSMLFLDFFNPGIDILRYSHEQNGINCTYGALFHGGSFIAKDLYRINWLKSFELAWFSLYNKIYTPATHINLQIPEQHRKKIINMPWGMDGYKPYKSLHRPYDVVFPHRLNSDKGIEDLLYICSKLPNLKFVIPGRQKISFLSSNQYYKELKAVKNVEILDNVTNNEFNKLLAKSKIILSCSKQELFGYSVMKGVLSGCYPVLPNREVYPHFFPIKYLYESLNDAVDQIETITSHSYASEDLLTLRDQIINLSFENILKDFFDNK